MNLVVGGDQRALAITPGQIGMYKLAPVQLIFVADLHKLTNTAGFQEPGLHDPEVQKSYYFVDTGLIAGNVHLFAAASGLAAWFHNCDKARLATALKLEPHQRALFAQSVGYPASE
jgi:nitroreductase